MKIFSSKNLVTLLFIVMIIGSAVLLLWVTDNGIGLTTDLTIYLTTANSLIAGRGFNAFGEPMTHYPPIYPPTGRRRQLQFRYHRFSPLAACFALWFEWRAVCVKCFGCDKTQFLQCSLLGSCIIHPNFCWIFMPMPGLILCLSLLHY